MTAPLSQERIDELREYAGRALQDCGEDARVSACTMPELLALLAAHERAARLEEELTEARSYVGWMVPALYCAESYISKRVENPDRGTEGRCKVLPMIRAALGRGGA